MSSKIPENPAATTIPGVLIAAYLVSYSTAAPFANIRAYLPAGVVRYTVPALFYIHVLESLLAAYRSVNASRPFSDTVKWFLATMVWGFKSLEMQKRQLRLS